MTSTLVPTAELHAAGYIGEHTYCSDLGLSCGSIPVEPTYAVAVELPVVEDDFVGPLS